MYFIFCTKAASALLLQNIITVALKIKSYLIFQPLMTMVVSFNIKVSSRDEILTRLLAPSIR